MNGFDRVVVGEDNWIHGPRWLPPTPQEFNVDLRSDLQELKDAISMPRQKVSNLINKIEKGKVSDEEFAILRPSYMGIGFGSGIFLDLVLFADRIIAELKSNRSILWDMEVCNDLNGVFATI